MCVPTRRLINLQRDESVKIRLWRWKSEVVQARLGHPRAPARRRPARYPLPPTPAPPREFQPEAPQLGRRDRAVDDQNPSRGAGLLRFGLRTRLCRRGERVGRRLEPPAQGCSKVRAARAGSERIGVQSLDTRPKTGRQSVDLGRPFTASFVDRQSVDGGRCHHPCCASKDEPAPAARRGSRFPLLTRPRRPRGAANLAVARSW